jgi:hypothetical protein
MNLMQDEQRRSVRALSLAAGTIGGFLIAALALILLGHMNIELAAVWRDLFVTSTAHIQSAMAWWLMAGTALAGGFAAAAATRFLMLSWWPLRSLRWIAGACIVAGLGVAGHVAAEPTDLDAAAHVAANLSGMVASLIAACVGAFFAARR